MGSDSSTGFWRGRCVAVTGGAGFIGRAVVDALRERSADVRVIRSAQHDMRDPRAAREALEGAQTVVHLAANVGGIGFNRRNPGPLVYDNLMMTANVFEQARLAGVANLVAGCTVCAYPKVTGVPFRESELWSGYPEDTNAPYGLAKKMMLVLSDAYRRQYGFDSCVPMITNAYGPGDNFDLEDSHVIPAMIRKFVEARDSAQDRVMLWGSGDASREFIYVDDVARALLLGAERLHTSEPVNIGTGIETRIRDLAEMISEMTGFRGEIVWDTAHPDGQPSRWLDVSRARELLGFEAQVKLREGLRRTIESFVESRRSSAAV